MAVPLEDTTVVAKGTASQEEVRPGVVLIACGVSAAIALGAYVLWFWRNPAGPPASWGEFGDYVGGIVGTVLAAVTVYLLVLSVRLNRGAYDEMKRQTKALHDEAIARDIQHKLDGLLAEWRRAMGHDFRGLIGWANGSDHDIGLRSRESVFTTPSILKYIFAVPPAQLPRFRARWVADFGLLGGLLSEFAMYCREYERLVGNRILTDYYRRRVSWITGALVHMSVISANLAAELRPEPEE